MTMKTTVLLYKSGIRGCLVYMDVIARYMANVKNSKVSQNICIHTAMTAKRRFLDEIHKYLDDYPRKDSVKVYKNRL